MTTAQDSSPQPSSRICCCTVFTCLHCDSQDATLPCTQTPTCRALIQGHPSQTPALRAPPRPAALPVVVLHTAATALCARSRGQRLVPVTPSTTPICSAAYKHGHSCVVAAAASAGHCIMCVTSGRGRCTCQFLVLPCGFWRPASGRAGRSLAAYGQPQEAAPVVPYAYSCGRATGSRWT